MTRVAGSPFQKAELNFTQLRKMAHSISEGMAGKPKENSLVESYGVESYGVESILLHADVEIPY